MFQVQIGRSREATQDALYELFEDLRNFPDFLLIQASITLSAHSLLFLGSSRTRRSNSFQSSTVYSSSIIRPNMIGADISATLENHGSQGEGFPLEREGVLRLGSSDGLDVGLLARTARHGAAAARVVSAPVVHSELTLGDPRNPSTRCGQGPENRCKNARKLRKNMLTCGNN